MKSGGWGGRGGKAAAHTRPDEMFFGNVLLGNNLFILMPGGQLRRTN